MVGVKRYASSSWCVLLLVSCGAAASAQILSYPGFSSVNGLTLSGTAAAVVTGDGTVLRLTPAKGESAGSAFAAGIVPFLDGSGTFSTFFQFRITNPGGVAPADGIVFVLRNAGSASLGQAGGNEGYDGIGNSVAVKLDTFQNSGEINNNFVAVQTNGVLMNESAQSPYGVTQCNTPSGVMGCLSNGHLWSVWIDYDGAVLHVAVADGTTVRPPDLIHPAISIPALLNHAAGVYPGFTAGTGGGFENHDIVNWQYFNIYSPTPVGVAQTIPAAR